MGNTNKTQQSSAPQQAPAENNQAEKTFILKQLIAKTQRQQTLIPEDVSPLLSISFNPDNTDFSTLLAQTSVTDTLFFIDTLFSTCTEPAFEYQLSPPQKENFITLFMGILRFVREEERTIVDRYLFEHFTYSLETAFRCGSALYQKLLPDFFAYHPGLCVDLIRDPIHGPITPEKGSFIIHLFLQHCYTTNALSLEHTINFLPIIFRDINIQHLFQTMEKDAITSLMAKLLTSYCLHGDRLSKEARTQFLDMLVAACKVLHDKSPAQERTPGIFVSGHVHFTAIFHTFELPYRDVALPPLSYAMLTQSPEIVNDLLQKIIDDDLVENDAKPDVDTLQQRDIFHMLGLPASDETLSAYPTASDEELSAYPTASDEELSAYPTASDEELSNESGIWLTLSSRSDELFGQIEAGKFCTLYTSPCIIAMRYSPAIYQQITTQMLGADPYFKCYLNIANRKKAPNPLSQPLQAGLAEELELIQSVSTMLEEATEGEDQASQGSEAAASASASESSQAEAEAPPMGLARLLFSSVLQDHTQLLMRRIDQNNPKLGMGNRGHIPEKQQP